MIRGIALRATHSICTCGCCDRAPTTEGAVSPPTLSLSVLRQPLSPNTSSDTCKIQSSRLDRIFWSHKWCKVVPSQKSVNKSIRNSREIQVYQVSQILLALSSGLMGVSCLYNSLFDSRWYRYTPNHIYMYSLDFVKNKKIENVKFNEFLWGFQNFQKM